MRVFVTGATGFIGPADCSGTADGRAIRCSGWLAAMRAPQSLLAAGAEVHRAISKTWKARAVERPPRTA